jgi:hypothetical protein
MRLLLYISSFIVFTLVSFTGMQQKQKIVFFGDSITQAGVSPTGYITVLGNLIAQKGLKDQYELVGAGAKSKDKVWRTFVIFAAYYE